MVHGVSEFFLTTMCKLQHLNIKILETQQENNHPVRK
jgi:hypothetical protein